MPFQFLDVPNGQGYAIVPALLLCQGEQVGGDAIFVEVDRHDGKQMFLLVDVMGHGAGAAQVVELLRDTYLPSSYCENLAPAVLLLHLQDLLQNLLWEQGRFICVQAVLLDAAGAFVTSNAGLPLPWVGKPGGLWHQRPVPEGPLLGFITPGAGYGEDVVTLQPNDQFLAFTDGVSEAMPPGRPVMQFQHHLGAFLDGLPAGLRAGHVVLRLLSALQRHAGAAWPADDTTLWCVERID